MEMTTPKDLTEALTAIDQDPDAVLLAGGTDVMIGVNFGETWPSHVVGLRRLAELTAWEGNRIGAGVTYRRLEKGPFAALAELSRTVGSPQIRNAGTIGGNLGTASPAGDALPFLAAVDAEVELASLNGRRTLPWHEFLVGVKRNAREPNELIVATILPEAMPPRQAFAKVGIRNAMVISTVSACLTRREDGTTTIALGSVAPTTIRARKAEAMISSEKSPTEAAIAEFGRLVSEEIKPISDHRSTAAYRRHAAGVLAKRLLERCL
ncbi:MAG: xanthine dehydrogenase family protein subunit M [Acidimicrobiia bacterium]|nr:xanthine dehydrogenase family protein subunit M [Acidimicrobiia bacterium]